MTNTKKCTCTNAFQDKMYGQGMRVYTLSAKGEARCTVCGTNMGSIGGMALQLKGKKK